VTARLHPAAWMVWTASASAVILSLDNPVLIVLSLGALGFVATSLAPDRGPFGLMLKIGLIALAARTVLFALTGHPSGEILFTMPQVRVPALLGGFTLGGPVTASVVVHSAIEGARLAALLCCFGVFLSAVEATRVVRLMPRFLFEAGLIVAIAISFVPSLARTARDVRDARRIRGERVRGWRGTTLAIPILASTLERAVTVAESMEARGYGRVAGGDAGREAFARLRTLAGVTLLTGGGLLAAVAGVRGGWMVFAAGGALAASGLRALSGLSARTRYRRDRMRGADAAVTVAAVAVAVVSLGLRGAWSYAAYPSVTMPAVPVAGVLVVACLASPVAIVAWHARSLRRASRDPAGAAAVGAAPVLPADPLPVAGGQS